MKLSKNFRVPPMTDDMLPVRGVFTSEIIDKNKEEIVEVITLSITKGATFLVTIAVVNCKGLIDTGATRSCISETFYNHLMLPWLLKLSVFQ